MCNGVCVFVCVGEMMRDCQGDTVQCTLPFSKNQKLSFTHKESLGVHASQGHILLCIITLFSFLKNNNHLQNHFKIYFMFKEANIIRKRKNLLLDNLQLLKLKTKGHM